MRGEAVQQVGAMRGVSSTGRRDERVGNSTGSRDEGGGGGGQFSGQSR